MLTEEKIKQVRKQLRSGVPQGEIKNDLIKEGYTNEDLEKIFEPHRPDMRNWYLFFAILFLGIGLYKLITITGLLTDFFFLIFSAAMFSVYYLERERIKKSSA